MHDSARAGIWYVLFFYDIMRILSKCLNRFYRQSIESPSLTAIKSSIIFKTNTARQWHC